jgi:hypothetical protein
MRVFLFLFTFSILTKMLFCQPEDLRVLIIGEGEAWSDPEEMRIRQNYGNTGLTFSWIQGGEAAWKELDPDKYDIIWVHRPDSLSYAGFEDDHAYYDAMLHYADRGGSILLTQHALTFLNRSGLEPVGVEHRSKGSEDNGYGRMLGFHAFLHHPLFDSLNGGAYVWKPPYDTTVTQCGFFDEKVPQNGKVVAVDWDYIFVRENSKLIVEYEVGKGKVLGIGAYFNLDIPNLNRQHYDLFYRNVFDYLAGKKEGHERHYWRYGEQKAEPLDFVLFRQFIPPGAKKWEINDSWPDLHRDQARHEYCEVAGTRMLVAAYEPGGIFEVWAHPFMAFRDYQVMLYFGDDTIVSLNEARPSITVAPASVTRNYSFHNGAIMKEVMTVAPDKPVGVIHYEYEGPAARLLVQYKTHMRLMWPYPENVLKTLKYGYQPGLNAMEVTAPEGNLSTFIGASRIPSGRYAGPCVREDGGNPSLKGFDIPSDSVFGVCAGQYYDLATSDQLDIVFAAGSDGRDSLAALYMRILSGPEEVYRASVKHYRDLFDRVLMITSPDEHFNKGYAWAIAATDRFFVETPGLGTSIVAGYNGTDRGWDGGHAVNGRPGYAWYFGRDAVWSAFAILDYGDFEGVKDILGMFVKYQDLNGKIYHELSTSGFAHYDASDATPLFISLAGRYFEQSGDTAFIKNIWPAIEKAYEYCLSTDTDGDGLIENTNVGHGWVEGGHLFGSHTSLYLASCWADALLALSVMDMNANNEYWSKAMEVEDLINRKFINKETGFMYQGIYKDGSFHTGQSIMPAVAMYFLALDDSLTTTMLRKYAGHEYTSDWGVRMASVYSEHYHPRGYHSGAVWPLYTGWVALAEYKYGRPLQAFGHVMGSLNNYRDFALGYIEEVLNGEKYLPSGVCPHQCWSETMTLQPLIEGMLGLGMINTSYLLEPALPFHWDSLKVENIRLGSICFDWEMHRGEGKTRYTFSGDIREDLFAPSHTFLPGVAFSPLFPPGTEINDVQMNGRKIKYKINSLPQGEQLIIGANILNECDIIVKHSGGIALIPPFEMPARGETSQGIRIIEARWEDNTYTIEMEGAPAMAYELEMINHFGTPKTVEGATFREEGGKLFLRLEFPALNRTYMSKTVHIGF